MPPRVSGSQLLCYIVDGGNCSSQLGRFAETKKYCKRFLMVYLN